MALDEIKYQTYVQILKEELVPSNFYKRLL